MTKNNSINQHHLPLIEHQVEAISINQRANDGYINATALCKASGRMFSVYNRSQSTILFLQELSADVQIPTSELVQVIKGGEPYLQGTWVHPQVAINLAQWASPKFAVLVSKWVFEWMNGGGKESYKFPYHIRRYLINHHKIPHTHFSMLNQVTVKLLGSLEAKGYIVPAKLMPDISMGKIFSNWLRDKGYDPDSFDTYEHVFDDGVRPVISARLYPNELMSDFNIELGKWITSGKALKYFTKKDENSVEAITAVYQDLKSIENKN